MKRINRTALSAMFAALGCIIIYAGALFGKADIATAILASLCVALVEHETGKARAIAVYIIICIISLLLSHQKTAGILFAAFFGYYPLLKSFLEEKICSRVVVYAIKYAVMNTALAALFIASLFIVRIHIAVIIGAFAIANIALPFYDIVFRQVVEYCLKLISKIR